jgi:predicted O-linked N-acetylglucosamine transferase (SPINDLY family)
LAGYETLALRLAHEPDLLATVRRRLAANRLTWPLFDCARFARHLETAYETMWAIHCAGGEPRDFGVLPQALPQ